MQTSTPAFHAAIACGGTGGHLFPGIAIAQLLLEEGGDVTLILSEKAIDKQTSENIRDCAIVALPTTSFQHGVLRCLKGLSQSYREIKEYFRTQPPSFVLGMGGFASAAPVWAGRALGIPTFIHDSNAIPGRANRWLAPWVDGVFVGLEPAAARLRNAATYYSGTPTRPGFEPTDPGSSRIVLGLSPDKPVLCVTGGSQGASAINQLMIDSLPALQAARPDLQIVHITGTGDHARVKAAYARFALKSLVRPFLTEMEVALNAATLVIARAGASSLAEMAAVQAPSIVIPYPFAADNHQWHNARIYADAGAARLMEQKTLTAELLAKSILELISDNAQRERMKNALASLHKSDAAKSVVSVLLDKIGLSRAPRKEVVPRG